MTEDMARSMRLGLNFSLWEMVYSKEADRLGLMNYQLNIPELYILNLSRLVSNILQPLRNELRTPIRVNSGYRSPELNEAIGGVLTSDHLAGKAADIYIPGKMYIAFAYIKNRCKFKQLIDEHGLLWIHVSYDEFNNKGQILFL